MLHPPRTPQPLHPPRPRAHPRNILLLALAFLLGSLVPVARADADRPTLQIILPTIDRLGLPTSVWSVAIAVIDTPTPLVGSLRLEVRQDPSQSATIDIPVDVPPGSTRLTFPLSLARNANILAVSLLSADGETIDRRRFLAEIPPDRLPPLLPPEQAPGVPAEFLTLADLPADWPSFDAAERFATSASRLHAATDAQRAALSTWVRSGGHALILADRPDTLALLAAADLPVTLSPVGIPALAANADREGWQIETSRTDPAAVVAVGPWGLGTLALRAPIADPSLQPLGDPERWAIWTDPVPLLAATSQGVAHGRLINSPGVVLSSASRDLSRVKLPSAAIPLALLGLGLALAIFLGPVDRLVLRRWKLTAWNWASPLPWIAAVSVGMLGVLALRPADTPRALAVAQVVGLLGPEGTPRAWSGTIARSVFSDAPDTLTPRGLTPGSYVSGASIAVSGTGSLPPLVMSASPGPGNLRQVTPAEIAVPRWTVRSMLQRVPIGSPWPFAGVRAERDGEVVRVRVDLPQDAGPSKVEVLAGRNAKALDVRWDGSAWVAEGPMPPTPRGGTPAVLFEPALPGMEEPRTAFHARARAGWAIVGITMPWDGGVDFAPASGRTMERRGTVTAWLALPPTGGQNVEAR